MVVGIGLCLALAASGIVGCASSAERRDGPPPDRTRDPEFEAARGAARPEFETQAEALAAGVYEPFVHPDSVAAGDPATAAGGPSPSRSRDRGDPSTEELLGTLGSDVQYNRGVAADVSADGVGPDPVSREGVWTLQIGAFGSETGALVSVRELQRRFPELPAWQLRGRDGMVRVFLGRFPDEVAAGRALERARSAGYPDAWLVRALP